MNIFPKWRVSTRKISRFFANQFNQVLSSLLFIEFIKQITWSQFFCWFFSRVLTTKYFILHRFKIDPQKAFFYTPHPWGKSTKVFFQKWQKTTYQTSSNRSILMVFDRFNDVWYAVFCQFWNKTFVDFSQGCGV